MRLKKLEVKGFKSFANQTTVLFSNNVTGIVGPNGSGKSNVVDAIRWVLGEQKSKELRLEKMGDILFNGTKKRAKAKVAQVSMTFDNDKGLLPTEYTEVSVSRILYRSGQSEYRLNNVTCRLKDVTNLLANTGIGSNSYAIIELGMVDDILSNKNDSRRRMFEQAAGIYHFKKRKHDTALKLKATNADLERVDDLLHEIESQLKQLNKQAKRARKYLKLKDDYKAKSILLAAYNLSEFKDNYADLKNKIETKQAEHTKNIAELNQVTADLEKQKANMVVEEEELTVLQKQSAKMTNEIKSIEHQINLAEQEIKFAKESKLKEEKDQVTNSEKENQLNRQLEDLVEQISILSGVLEAKKSALAVAEDAKSELEGSLKNEKEAHSVMVRKQLALNKSITDYERQLAVMQNRKETEETQIERTINSIKDQKTRLENLTVEVEQIEKDRNLWLDKINDSEKDLENRQQRKFEIEKEIESVNNQLSEVHRELDARQNEFDLLKNMIDNLEGYPDSIKFLAKHKQWTNSLILLSDIVNCPDKYKKSIEAVLEPYLNYYIVENRNEALAAVEILTEAQKGRGSFFCMDGIVKENKPKPKDIDPSWIAAIDVVKDAGAFSPLLNSLLHNVYLVEKQPVKILDHITCVTIDGNIIAKSDVINGGSIGLFDGKKIGRKQTLAKLEESLSELSAKNHQLNTRKDKLLTERASINIDEVQKSLRHRQSEWQKKNQQYGQLTFSQQEIKTTISKNESLVQNSESNKANIEKEYLRMTSALTLAQNEFTSLENSNKNKSDSLEGLNTKLNEVVSAYNTANIEFIQAKNGHSANTNTQNIISRQKEDLKRSQINQTDQLEKWSTKISTNEQKIVDFKETLATLYAERKVFNEQIRNIEEVYFKDKNSVFSKDKERTRLNKLVNQNQDQINELKDEYNEVRIKINDITQRTKVEFGLESRDIMAIEYGEEINGEELTAEVEKMRHKLFNFGEINSLAVEAYEEMEIRFNSINEQKNDIVEAQKSLEETIKELEELATEKFMEAFYQVKNNFQNIFRSLFSSEDSCDVILLEENNPLESPIEIIAKPKGKRPKSLSQLSGGEKTLTATALLFALYLLKPAPFCIFDEVDAPLDDSNIEKFNNVIKDFSGDSQFIIITHNKLTMAAVDVIYGVYMDEPGVSNVTPVDFSDLKHEAMHLELSEN